MSDFFIFKIGNDATVSIRISSIYYVRIVGSTVEIQYGMGQKQTITMSKYYNEEPLRHLMNSFGISNDEINRHWSCD